MEGQPTKGRKLPPTTPYYSVRLLLKKKKDHFSFQPDDGIYDSVKPLLIVPDLAGPCILEDVFELVQTFVKWHMPSEQLPHLPLVQQFNGLWQTVTHLIFLPHHEAHIMVELRWMIHLAPKAQCLGYLWGQWFQLNCICLQEGKLCFDHDDGELFIRQKIECKLTPSMYQ